jgi:hypothetical protein
MPPKLVPRQKGTPQQVRDYDIARRELNRNAERERRRGVQKETKKYLRLNHQVRDTEKPLSPWQRAGSGMRLDREERQERRTERRERRNDHQEQRSERRERRFRKRSR